MIRRKVPLRQVGIFLGAILLSCSFGAAGETPATMPAAVPAAVPQMTAPTTAPAQQTYDLRLRPAVGLRWAYQCLADSEMNLRGTAAVAGSDAMLEKQIRNRVNVVVDSEEITEMRNG